MSGEWYTDKLKRKTIVTGHYGSGKTEFSVSLALQYATSDKQQPIALIDLDIVNPYFRSRERREMLEDAGIAVYGSIYNEEITAELPALGATIRTPLENANTRIIVDLGGNDSGALVINQFAKYFSDADTSMIAVVNANRPDTSSVTEAIEHIAVIEKVTGFIVSGVVSNTHMLRETTVKDVENGYILCSEICDMIDKELICLCYPQGIVTQDDIMRSETLSKTSVALMPMGLHMRPSWLDR